MPAEALIDPGAHDQGAGIVATAFNATNPLRYLPSKTEQAWSALEWAQSPEGWLFLTSTEDSRDAALPLQSVWLDCIVRGLMAEQERREQVWIVADELPVLKRQSQLEALVVRGPKRGLCAVLGFQAITQLRAIYGQEQTTTLAAAPATKLILRTGEAETARWSSAQIGEGEISRTQIGTNNGIREHRDSFSVYPQRVIESSVLGSEVHVVERADSDAGRLSVKLNDGRPLDYSPKRLAGVEGFRVEQRKFAAGDRIQFRAPERTFKLANGEFATIVAIDERTARIRTEDGRVVEAHRLRHIDYGYASTSHSSQGATVDRVIVNIDTMRSADLVNRKQFYVSISRARHGISVYTDDRERLRQVVNRSREKSTALEQIPVNVSHSFKIIPERTLLAQNRSYGIRR